MPLFTLTSSQNGIHFNRLKNWIVDDISISLGIHFNQLKSLIVDVNTHTPYIGITLVYIYMNWLERCTGIAGPLVLFLPEEL